VLGEFHQRFDHLGALWKHGGERLLGVRLRFVSHVRYEAGSESNFDGSQGRLRHVLHKGPFYHSPASRSTLHPLASPTDGRSVAQPVGSFVTNTSPEKPPLPLKVVSKAPGVVGRRRRRFTPSRRLCPVALLCPSPRRNLLPQGRWSSRALGRSLAGSEGRMTQSQTRSHHPSAPSSGSQPARAHPRCAGSSPVLHPPIPLEASAPGAHHRPLP
jgi:hypothetical protein